MTAAYGVSGQTVRVNGPSLRVDVGRAGFSPQQGDMVYNTNASATPAGAGPLVRGAAAWKNLAV